MEFHMSSGFWFSSFGVELSETFRITNDGAELLGEFLRKLFMAWFGLYCRGGPWPTNPDHHLRPKCTLWDRVPDTADNSQIHYG